MMMPGRTYSAQSSYRYGFNGKENDNEVKGEGNQQDYGARVYDPRVGRWLSSDPLAALYPHQSPYVAMSNDPLNRIDPTGMGDYYGQDGKHLGSDGKTIKDKKGKVVGDDKAYVTSQAIVDLFTKNGKTDWDKVIANSNTSELSVGNSTLGKFANAIINESSGDQTESYALASTIMNLSRYKNKSVLKTLQTEGIYGYTGNTNYSNSEHSMGAVINALTGGDDYSHGAIRWDGFDLAGRGFDHIKARTFGIEVSEEHLTGFKAAWPDDKLKSYSGGKFTSFSSNFTSNVHLASQGENAGRSLYKSTAVHGSTMFWGVNKDPIVQRLKTYGVMFNPHTNLGRVLGKGVYYFLRKEDVHVNNGYKKWRSL
jgi:RHS repeat-associated protein